jgi:hypothetical protein
MLRGLRKRGGRAGRQAQMMPVVISAVLYECKLSVVVIRGRYKTGMLERENLRPE